MFSGSLFPPATARHPVTNTERAMPAIRTVRLCSLPLLFSVILLPAAFAQTTPQHSGELEARVEVLSDFHEVIFQIWHTAWPEKNVGMLVELLPQVKHYSDTLSRVTLPGILRDKQGAWDEGTASLKKVVVEYEAASAPVDSARLLDAAERLHAQYEALVRTIRPVTRELDQFHQVLYMIYHHYWPGRDLERLAPAVDSLKVKMAALSASTLPGRLKEKEAAFASAKKSLAGAVEKLAASDAGSNPEKFASDLERVHGEYQALERVFE